MQEYFNILVCLVSLFATDYNYSIAYLRNNMNNFDIKLRNNASLSYLKRTNVNYSDKLIFIANGITEYKRRIYDIEFLLSEFNKINKTTYKNFTEEEKKALEKILFLINRSISSLIFCKNIIYYLEYINSSREIDENEEYIKYFQKYGVYPVTILVEYEEISTENVFSEINRLLKQLKTKIRISKININENIIRKFKKYVALFGKDDIIDAKEIKKNSQVYKKLWRTVDILLTYWKHVDENQRSQHVLFTQMGGFYDEDIYASIDDTESSGSFED